MSTKEPGVQDGVATAGRVPQTGRRLLSRRSDAALVRAGGRPRVEVVVATAHRYGASARPQGWCCVE